MNKNVRAVSFKFFMAGLVVSLFFIHSTVNAQAVSPFGCKGSYYVTYGNFADLTFPTSFDKITYNNSGIISSFKGTTSSYGFNAADINPVDGFMYGIRYYNGVTVDLLKIDSNANVTTIGTLPAYANNAQSVYAGCFDMNGDFYIANQPTYAAGSTCTIYKVNTTNANTTLIGSTGLIPDPNAQLFFVDIAIDPTTGIMYGATNYCCNETGDNSRALYTIDKTTGLATKVGQFTTSAGAQTTGYGLFFTANGDLFLYGTDAKFYLVNKSTAAITALGNGASYSFADGASCAYRVEHTLTLSLPVICLPDSNSTTNPLFTEKFINNRGSAINNAAYHLDLHKRFSFTQTANDIKDTLLANGIATNATIVTITSVNGGINNSIDILPVNVPYSGPGTTTSFTLATLFTNKPGSPTILAASKIYNLPSIIGSEVLSDDPLTIIPGDSTKVSLCNGGPLPVSFVSLYAAQDAAGNIAVQWQSSNEMNIQYYEVERSSDGIHFIIEGKVAATNAGNYSFTDKFIATDKLFYKIIATDISGKKTITPIVIVNLSKKQFAITASPNPFKDNIQLQVLSSKEQQAMVRIFGSDGKLYQSYQLNVKKGSSVTELTNTKQLPTGVYAIFVNMLGTADIYSTKIVKQ